MKAATFHFLLCFGLVSSSTSVVLGAPFRHEPCGVVIHSPAEWRMMVRNGFAPYYSLHRSPHKEDHEELLRRMKEGASNSDLIEDDDFNKRIESQTCGVRFNWIMSDRDHLYQHFLEPNYFDQKKIEWEEWHTTVSAERVITGSITEIRLVGDFKTDPGRRFMEIHRIGPRASVGIRCGTTQARFEKLQQEVAEIVRGIAFPK
jgi:hypothetical protein